MKRFEKHIFICENKRAEGHPKGCCFDCGSPELKNIFKKRLTELGLKDEIRVNTAGCLDACEYGAAIVIYPEQIWYGGVTQNDIEEIIQSHLLKNTPVERLKITDKKFNKDGE